MKFTRLSLPELVRIDPEPIQDSRGFFARLLCTDELSKFGIESSIVQCNNTLTRNRGSVRGLHFQRPPKAETKIVRCVRGMILDVGVDLRLGSTTYGHHDSCELSESNRAMLVIPPGFAHGFQTLTDDVELIYFHTAFYSPEHEGGLDPLDPQLAIQWPLSVTIMSDKDQALPGIKDVAPISL